MAGGCASRGNSNGGIGRLQAAAGGRLRSSASATAAAGEAAAGTDKDLEEESKRRATKGALLRIFGEVWSWA